MKELSGQRDRYKEAGVDIAAGNAAVERMKSHVGRTMRPEVLTKLGGYGGGFMLDMAKYREPVLVSGTDGVGTKLKLAFATNKHDTIGIDAVAMCVNDILAMGAEPLFFLDYFATGRLDPVVAEQVIKGVADGCEQAMCALVGGETAEMPGMYQDGEYDIAGFSVGVVERSRMIDGSTVAAGDALIGFASSGLHSNGFSLVRHLLADDVATGLTKRLDGLGETLGEALLRPTRIYVKSVLPLLQIFSIHAMAHITGGGFLENIPRVLPEGCGAVIRRGAWIEQPIFGLLQRAGALSAEELFRTFNMGIGYVCAVGQADADAFVAAARERGEDARIIGEVVAGERQVKVVG